MPERSVSVVIPCFNEEHAIAQTIDAIEKALAGTGEVDLVVVDDGSTDGSLSILTELARTHDSLQVVKHQRNLGYGAALKSGIRRARHDLIAITDADGTYPHDRLPELLALAAEADMVVGARTGPDARTPWLRRLPKWFLRRYASWIVGQEIPDLNSGMRVFRRQTMEQFVRILPDTFSFTTTITIAMLRNRYEVRYVPIAYAARVGKSKIKPIRDSLRFCQLIVRTGMYFAPLRVLSPVIVVLTLAFLASALYDLFVLANLTDKTLLFMFGAVNATMLGLLADMIDKRSGG